MHISGLEGYDIENMPLDVAARMVQDMVPSVWKAVNTKTIDAPGTHYGFKALATMFAGSIMAVLWDEHDRAACNISAIAGRMAEYNYPVYYVSRPLLDALRHTHPPEGMVWSDVFMPFPALVFMLPVGALAEPAPSNRPIVAVGVAKFEPGQLTKVPGTDVVVRPGWFKDQWTEPRISVFWVLGPSCITGQDATFKASLPLEPDPGWLDCKTEEFNAYYQQNMNAGGTASEFSSYVAGLVANMLLVMEARKQVVEHGGPTNRVLKSGLRVHRPNFIGRKYEVLRQQSSMRASAGGHFTELGWRSGYIRRQHVGKGNADVKLVLIDPYIAYTSGLVREEKQSVCK